MPAVIYPNAFPVRSSSNLFLDSDAPATQNVNVLAQEYTLSFVGTGSITLSGASTDGPLAGTGPADRVSLSFTPSAGVLTLTVAGSVADVQLIVGDTVLDYVATFNQPRPEVLPETYARILYEGQDAFYSATTEEEGYVVEYASEPSTDQWWRSTGADALTMTFSAPRVIDAVGVAAHRLNSISCQLEVYRDGGWVELFDLTPSSDDSLLFLFPPVEVDAVRLVVADIAEIGVMYAGQSLTMYRRGYVELGPINMARRAELTTLISDGGQFQQRTIRELGLVFPVSWDDLPEPWVRSTLDPFLLSAITEPFFVASRPGSYPEDTAYAWCDEVMVPRRSGRRNFMTLSSTWKGHVNG